MMSKKAQMRLKLESTGLHPLSKQSSVKLDLTLHSKIIAISGDSGAGKTTLLQRLAGIDARGLKKQNDQAQLNDVAIVQNDVASNPCVYVGAETALIDHLSLRKNLMLTQDLSLWIQKREQMFAQYALDAPAAHQLEALVDICELTEFIDKPCYQLSGGEKQRGQLARALICGKPILLLDEALSAMDAGLRGRIQHRLRKLNKEHHQGMVFISHSMEEVLRVSDKVALMEKGEIVYFGNTLKQHEVSSHRQLMATEISTLEVRYLQDEPENALSVFALKGNDSEPSMLIYCKQFTYAAETERLLVNSKQLVLSKDQAVQSSMLNSLRGEIIEITAQESSALVGVNINGQRLNAQITKKSLNDLALTLGDTVLVLFKAL